MKHFFFITILTFFGFSILAAPAVAQDPSAKIQTIDAAYLDKKTDTYLLRATIVYGSESVPHEALLWGNFKEGFSQINEWILKLMDGETLFKAHDKSVLRTIDVTEKMAAIELGTGLRVIFQRTNEPIRRLIEAVIRGSGSSAPKVQLLTNELGLLHIFSIRGSGEWLVIAKPLVDDNHLHVFTGVAGQMRELPLENFERDMETGDIIKDKIPISSTYFFNSFIDLRNPSAPKLVINGIPGDLEELKAIDSPFIEELKVPHLLVKVRAPFELEARPMDDAVLQARPTVVLSTGEDGILDVGIADSSHSLPACSVALREMEQLLNQAQLINP